ncbi:hypothetical protein DRJ04_01095 [Candidatus Aerophobetes bacterium]|uniref:Uncharacterized protein n=1 Tax=Aerophobetes bacterium TaxID=2030807 RepID=A0A662DLB4_UNCAE|nr:MAG: hypothetical protein DRJ04_01095 [Candidatus Aerophobetes bacterium]
MYFVEKAVARGESGGRAVSQKQINLVGGQKAEASVWFTQACRIEKRYKKRIGSGSLYRRPPF